MRDVEVIHFTKIKDAEKYVTILERRWDERLERKSVETHSSITMAKVFLETAITVIAMHLKNGIEDLLTLPLGEEKRYDFAEREFFIVKQAQTSTIVADTDKLAPLFQPEAAVILFYSPKALKFMCLEGHEIEGRIGGEEGGFFALQIYSTPLDSADMAISVCNEIAKKSQAMTCLVIRDEKKFYVAQAFIVLRAHIREANPLERGMIFAEFIKGINEIFGKK